MVHLRTWFIGGPQLPTRENTIKMGENTFSRIDKISMYRFSKNKNPEPDNNHITISRSRALFGPQNPILDRFCHTRSRFASQRPNPTILSHKRRFCDKKSPQSKISESKTACEFSFLQFVRSSYFRKYRVWTDKWVMRMQSRFVEYFSDSRTDFNPLSRQILVRVKSTILLHFTG